jgi:fluoride ion exporter CrcB/FEX
MPLILIGLGGFAGAISRYLVDGFVTERTAGAFPWGTLVVNLTGSFVLGLLFAMTTERAILPADIRGPVMIGFWAPALANLGGSVVVGLIAVAAGLTLGRAL